MRNIFRYVLCGLLVAIGIQAKANPLFGSKTLWNNEWSFVLDDATDLPAGHAGWSPVRLPHDWSVKGLLSPDLASCTGYLPGGIGWYKKSWVVPDSMKGQKLYIYFEGVYNRSEVYINGHLLGKRPNGYISFIYDLTPYLNWGGDNQIAVRVDHSRSADSRWYTGSGIYRNVYLVASGKVHMEPWSYYVYPQSVTSHRGELSISLNIENEAAVSQKLIVRNTLLSPDNKVVASNKSKVSVPAGGVSSYSSQLKVKSPRCWSVESPDLYTIKTVIEDNRGNVVDSVTIKTGFRSFRFDPNTGFCLNGKNMKVKGVCLHHDAGTLGAAVPREVMKRRLMMLKELGCNAVRTSHNPQAPDLYELCDEIGLLVMNEAFDEWEFPKRKWIKGWNVGVPGFQGSTDFFEEWGVKDMEDFVKRDRNHLCVFAWSIGNEVDYPNDPYSHPVLDSIMNEGFTQASFGGYKKDAPDAMRLGDIAKRLAAAVKRYDTTRPVTAGLAGVAMSNQTEYPAALDITGYNYTESRYGYDHEKYPRRVIFGSENRHDFEAWKAVRDNGHIFGQFLWTGIDYLGESGSWPSRGFYSGLLDFGGNIKPRGYFRQALWSDTPVAYLGTYPAPGYGDVSNVNKDVWMQLEEAAGKSDEAPSMDAWPIWNYNENQIIRVVCYTNARQAYLLLNDKRVGEVKPYDDETGMIFWDIPYCFGKLEVVGLDDAGKEIVRHSIRSSKRPYAIVAEYADREVPVDGVAQIKIQVVDEDGQPVVLSDNLVKCTIAGPATLLGLEASDNTDMGNYTDHVQRVFNGQLWAYVRADGMGKIRVRFTADWLQGCDVEIKSFN